MLKRVLPALLAICFLQTLVTTGSALADDGGRKVEGKAKDHKWWYLAALPVDYFLVQIPLHEGAHAAAAGMSSNYEVDKFQPYPHFSPDGSAFYTGSASILCRGAACDDKVGLGVISAAPYFADTVVFATADLLLSTNTVEAASVSGRILYLAGMVIPWWDTTFNAVWANDLSDAAHIATNLGIPRWKVMAVGMGVSTVGIWRLWHGYKHAFHGQRHDSKESNLVVVPMGDSGTIGATASLRF